MPSKRLLVAALLLASFALVTCEDTFLHSHDGCIVETHCNACLLRIATAGVLPLGVALPDTGLAVERVAFENVTAPEPPDLQTPASRGPPRG